MAAVSPALQYIGTGQKAHDQGNTVASSSTPSGEANVDKTKARTSRACSSCNRQKLRCDGGKPCSRCIISDNPDTCEYLPSLRGKTRKRKADREKEEGDFRGREYGSTNGSGRPPGGYAMWKKDGALGQTGATNTALWGIDKQPSSPPARALSFGPSPRSPREVELQRRNTIDDGLTTLPLPGDPHNPLAVLAEASVAEETDRIESPTSGFMPRREERIGQSREGIGVDNGPEGYYKPLERVLKEEAPHIMALIDVHEAEKLFDMFFEHIHPHLPFLDREHGQPSSVARRNNFLFNAICCVAARSFDIAIWERIKDFARFEMERLPREKNIEVVQGHLVYSVWNLIRPKHFEQDMSWIRIGTSVRTAIDINLHRVALVRQAREGLPSWLLRSIIRTWLLSYVVDRTMSAQLGKPSSMRGESSVRLYRELLSQSGSGMGPDDVWVAALVEWTQILARVVDTFRDDSLDHAAGTQNAHPDLVHVFIKQFRHWLAKSEAAAFSCGADPRMLGSMRLHDRYARLVVFSFGLQRSMTSPPDLPAAFLQYQSAALDLIDTFETHLEAPGLTRGCPDLVFTALTYAAVSLLKAAQPPFANLEPDLPRIFIAARRAADMLARAAMVPDHLPASQSAFISRLIELRMRAWTGTTDKALQSHNQIRNVDFEAFAASVDGDPSKASWPPPVLTSSQLPLFQENGSWQAQSNAGEGVANGTREPDRPTGQPMDISGFLAANQAALGLGMDMNTMGEGDLLFTQDAFWKSLLDGGLGGTNGV